MLRYVLDTNIAIYVIKRRPLQALARFNDHAGRMAVSAVTLAELLHGVGKSHNSLAELLHGAGKSHNPAQTLAVVEDFCSRLEVLPYGAKAAQHYGSIRAQLERLGAPIGVNDLHIAAHARSEGLVLVTNNLHEFDGVPALQVENWVD